MVVVLLCVCSCVCSDVVVFVVVLWFFLVFAGCVDVCECDECVVVMCMVNLVVMMMLMVIDLVAVVHRGSIVSDVVALFLKLMMAVLIFVTL